MPKDFKPPRHTESHVCVYDRKTGEILAMHTRWVDAGAEAPAEHVSRELLESIAADSGRAAEDLDVIKTRAGAPHDGARVDLRTRKIVAKRGSGAEGVLVSAPLRRP